MACKGSAVRIRYAPLFHGEGGLQISLGGDLGEDAALWQPSRIGQRKETLLKS